MHKRETEAMNRRMRRFVAAELEFYRKHSRALSGMAGDVNDNRLLATQPNHGSPPQPGT